MKFKQTIIWTNKLTWHIGPKYVLFAAFV